MMRPTEGVMGIPPWADGWPEEWKIALAAVPDGWALIEGRWVNMTDAEPTGSREGMLDGLKAELRQQRDNINVALADLEKL